MYSFRSQLPDTLQTVLFGDADPRLRATWRVLLSWVLLFSWAGITLTLTRPLQPYIDAAPPAARIILTISLGTACFLALFLIFPRYIDCRPLEDYGFAWSRTWMAELGVGFAVMFAGTALWHGVGIVFGWTSFSVAMTPTITEGLWFVALLVPWYFSGLTQSLLSLALVIKNGAEGLNARGYAPTLAVTGAFVVAVVFFVFRHDPTTATGVLHSVVGGAVFALLYVHSGNLALSIGAIGGANYINSFVFADPQNPASPLSEGLELVHVTKSFPEGIDFLAELNLPAMLFAYLLALGWLKWRRDGVTVSPALTQWTPRDG